MERAGSSIAVRLASYLIRNRPATFGKVIAGVSNIILRDYQATDLSRIVADMRAGKRRILYVLPTGGGKTSVAAYMLDGSRHRNQVGWFVVHRKELVDQTSIAFARAGIPHGIVMAGEPLHPWQPIQIVLIGSLKRRARALPPPNLIVTDEAHHANAASWDAMYAMYPQAWSIGLTATPRRLDGRGLGRHFDAMVLGPPMRWLIDNGYLADYRLFMPPPPNVGDVKDVGGDFNQKQLKAALEKSTIVGDAITEYRRHSDHQRALVRSVDIGFSIEVAEKFRAAGYRAAHVDGTFDRDRRRNIFDAFRAGAIEVLSQVELAGEGVDIPGIEVAIDLRPTKSITMAKQFWGRALRMSDGKGRAIILDHAGNALRHGFPDDEIEWTLEDTKKKKPSAPIFTCKACFASFPSRLRICPECGEILYDPNGNIGRARPDEVDGSLHEITKDDRDKRREADAKQQEEYKLRHLRKQELRRLHTLEDLEEFAKSKGYKPGWAKHVYEARQRSAEKYRRGVPA
jgi:superfamily II DNA or RNA helicase